MPINPVPPTIEASDFRDGWVASAEDAGLPPTALPRVRNLILEPITGAVVTRKGYKRVATLPQGYRIYSIHPYTAPNGDQFLMCVISANQGVAPNNVKLVAVNLDTLAQTTITPNNYQFADDNGRHWGATIDGTYYGGGLNAKMYSARWDGTTWTWKADPSTPTYDTWVDSMSPGANQFAKDYAFKKGDSVTYTYTKNGSPYTESFEAKKHIRRAPWDNEVKVYKRGDKVSLKGTWGYFRTYRCVEKHEPTNANKPPSKFWQKVQLPPPVDEDGKLNEDEWQRIPSAPKTNLAVWHSDRLYARNDPDRQVLIYSRQAKVAEKEAGGGSGTLGEPGNPEWDPADWRTTPGGIIGAGFVPFETKEGDDITALIPFGYYLLIFKEQSTFVLTNPSPNQAQKRQLAPVGAPYREAVTEHEGWVYFMSDRGFFRTEGTRVELVPGSEKIYAYLRDSLNWDVVAKDVSLTSFGDYIWISLPNNKSGQQQFTLLYEPLTTSFWPIDLRVQTMAVGRREGLDRLFFSTPNGMASNVDINNAVYAWTGTPERSTSTRTLSGVTTHTNGFKNPSFESANEQWDNPHDWVQTTPDYVRAEVTKDAARSRKYGLKLSNKRKKDSDNGPYNGYEGIQQSRTEDTGNYVVSFYVRRDNWSKHPKQKPDVKLHIGGIIQNNPTFTYVGDGWHRVWVESFLAAATRTYGLLLAPDTTVHVEQAMHHSGVSPVPYFDGKVGADASEAVYEGGTIPYLMQYDHPDADNKDDDESTVYTGRAIPWFLRTAWFTFGVLREERQVRSIWAMVRGLGAKVGFRTYRNFRSEPDNARQTITRPDDPVMYHEGWYPEDAWALSFEIEGDTAPAAVLGVAADTIPRRIRRST